MISRKELVRIGILPLALAFVRPGYSYKVLPQEHHDSSYIVGYPGGQRRGRNLRPQTGPPMHVTSRRGLRSARASPRAGVERSPILNRPYSVSAN